jgi:hypothetical protein
VIGEALEAQQPAERLFQRHVLLHRDVDAVDRGALDVEAWLLVFLGQPVHEVKPGRQSLCHRHMGKW